MHILAEAATAAGDPILGAKLGFDSRPGNIAPIGLLAIQSATIERALQAMARYVAALQSGTRMVVEREGEHLSLSYRIIVPVKAPLRQDAEFTLATTCCLIRHAFDARWRPLEIHFCHGAPGAREQAALKRLFGAPLLFGQSVNRIVLSATEAERVYRHEDADMIALLEQHLGEMIRTTHHAASIVEQVEALVGTYLGVWQINLDTIAAALHLSPRSLQRKLGEQGQSLSQIIQRQRQIKAETLLADPDLSIDAVAAALGYGDGTAFWRAYRNWTGHSPSQRR